MKKTLFYLIICFLLVSILVVPVAAKSTFAMDYAGVMSSGETTYLNDWCSQLQQDHGLDVVLLTVPNLMGTDIQNFADDFYENNRYGNNGLIFLVDMGSRQWHISTSGTAIELLSDSDLEKIEKAVIPYFSDGRYYDGFCHFLDILPDYLNNGEDAGINFILSTVIGAAIAGISVLVMRFIMNTKRPQNSAGSYENKGSYHLHMHQDLFLYSNVSKRPKPKNNSGSSTHRSSSGRSHGGRGGSF